MIRLFVPYPFTRYYLCFCLPVSTALHIFLAMEKHEYKPDQLVFQSLIKAFSELGDYETGITKNQFIKSLYPIACKAIVYHPININSSWFLIFLLNVFALVCCVN